MCFRFVSLCVFSLSLFSGFSLSALAAGTEWRVINDWSPAYEKKFSEFVRVMGESNCKSLDACLKSPAANPFYVARTPKNRNFGADCAYFPYALRMYFSWMEGLPFDYVSKVAQANPAEETSPDIRYTKFGNKPAGRRSIAKGQVTDGVAELALMRKSISTATFRMHYREVSDFFPPAVTRELIRPGAAVYDPSGHAAIIFKIEKDGRVRMMDAHPDNSVTRITFDQKFIRSRPTHGGGIKHWRPEGNLVQTDNLPGFSTEQYNTKFKLGGDAVSFYDFIRGQMAGGSLKFTPVAEIKQMMLETCSNLRDREAAVNAAIASNVQEKRHPDRLPMNIYGTNGEWEEYSTPSRDARLKVAFVELRQEIERFLTMYRARNARIDYQPVASKYSSRCAADNSSCFLVASLMSSYEEAVFSPSCIFSYKNSAGQDKKLSYSDIAARLFKLSFDPYHCVELRWGASGDELASCRDDDNKLAWYRNEQGLRNQTERTYETRMDFDLNGTARLGVASSPDIDLWGYLGKQLQ